MQQRPEDVHAEPEEEALAGPEGAQLVGRVVEEAFGEGAAEAFNRIWSRMDTHKERPEEGLRARKKRLTRQRISDVATALFVARGFDNVRVAEIAEKVGVSEKTVYNYFPTKESMVFDDEDEMLSRLTRAVAERPHGSSPTVAFVDALKRDMTLFVDAIGEERSDFLSDFARMVRDTPALRAAWGEFQHRLASALAAVLATELGVDPRDPEPVTAARAISSLMDLYGDSQLRRMHERADLAQLQVEIEADLDRAARLLDTGLWSLPVMAGTRRVKEQLLRDASRSADEVRKQVVDTVNEAKRVWREHARAVRDDTRQQAREVRAQAHRDHHRRR
ncbi:MAG: TetR/AcrR family transcriptional regulator [Solirubrobacterales bacterium]|nr:TetR/AcrR family transcriptional regulator [Solirubrobacterales bacterium]